MSTVFELASWRSPLAQAIDQNKSQAHHRFFQLATVTPKGLPSNRTVVFRGFVESTNQIKIITDHRSEKIQHLTEQNQVEIAWYFIQTREQFRISGSITAITSQDTKSPFFSERQQMWQMLSDAAKLQFSWPNPTELRNQNLADFSPKEIDPLHPSDSFVLLLITPNRVDHLELRGNPQNRWIYQQKKNETWTKIEVNP